LPFLHDKELTVEPLILKCRAELRKLFPQSENLREDYPLGTCAPPKNFTDIQHYVDLTNLKPAAVTKDIEELCAKAKAGRYAAVCTFQKFTPLAKQLLAGTNVAVCAVANFPGAGGDISTVEADIAYSVKTGAVELDPVHPIHLIKEKKYQEYLDFMTAVVMAAQNHTVKVILETQLLTDEEVVMSTLLCWMAGASGVKTSTGVNTFVDASSRKKTVHATREHVRLMRMAFGDFNKHGHQTIIKASGGISDVNWAKELMENGANRIGASGL
jgi:deoxyribose-phosphate aldolase